MGAWAGGWLGVALDSWLFLFNIYNIILASFSVLCCVYVNTYMRELVCHIFLHKKFVIV